MTFSGFFRGVLQFCRYLFGLGGAERNSLNCINFGSVPLQGHWPEVLLDVLNWPLSQISYLIITRKVIDGKNNIRMACENLGKVYICGIQKSRKGDYEKEDI